MGEKVRRGKNSPSTDNTVRSRLLEVATAFFARKGYAATTTREIVTEAGVTKPVLYYYFQNKEGIYIELMERASKDFEEVMAASLVASGSADESLLRFCDQVFGLVVEKIDVVRLMYSIYYGPPQGAPFFDIDAVYIKLFNSVLQIVHEGIKKKELREGNPEEMTWAILGAFHIIMENELSHPERNLGHEALMRILNLMFQGILMPREEQHSGEVK